MKVAIIGTYNTQDTGPSRVTAGLARGLALNDVSVDIYSHGDRHTNENDKISVKNFGETPDSLLGFVRFNMNVHREIQENKYDIVHPVEEYLYPTKIRTIQWTIESYQNWKSNREAFQGYRFLAGDVLLNFINRVGSIGTDHVVAISPETKSQLANNLWLDVDEVTPLGVNQEELSPPSEQTRKKHILFTGWIERKKGQKRVLDHLDSNSDSYVVNIVGGVKDEDYYDEISNWHDRHHGFVSRERFNELHEKSDIVVIPSYHDPYPTTGLEAIANGCSVVITEGCGFAQFDWAKPENGIHVVSNGEEAAQTINQLAKQNLSTEQQNAFELAKSMTWEKVAERYIDRYTKLL